MTKKNVKVISLSDSEANESTIKEIDNEKDDDPKDFFRDMTEYDLELGGFNPDVTAFRPND